MPTPPVDRASLRSAERADLNDLVALLGAAVPQCLPETVWQLPWAWSTYVVVRDGDRLVAAGSLQRVDERRAEIRGLVVAPSHQGNGLASAVVEELLRRGTPFLP